MSAGFKPIFSVDIQPDGTLRDVSGGRLSPEPAGGAAWRWLHCERTDPGFARWAKANLPPAAAAALVQVETRPHADDLGDALSLNFRAMNLNPGQESENMVSLRIWVTARLVVTTRQRRVFAVDELREEMAAGQSPQTTGRWLARLADRLTRRIEQATGEREDATDAVEEELLEERPESAEDAALGIARLARSVIKLRRYIAPQREALVRLAQSDAAFIAAADKFDLREIANRTARAVEELDTVRDRLASLRSHVDSLHAARLARNGFVLSVVAAIFLPLGFLTGLFGVNLAGIPGAEWPLAFFSLAVASLVIGLALWLMFRWMKWF